MTVQKKQLVESLKLAMPGIESGNVVLQGSDTFIFHNGKIFTYNDSMAVSIPIEQTGLVEEDIEGAVKADEFFKVVSKLPQDEISFEVSENNSWILKSGKAKVEMTLIDFDFESRLKGVEPTEDWIELNDDFISGISTCKMATNKTPLAGIFISGNTIVSTDGFQMNKYELKELNLPTFWITDNSVNELLKLKGLKEIQVQDTWVHFRLENGTLFSIKTLNKDKFPFAKIKSVMDNSSPKEDTLHAKFPKELFNSIDRALSFSMDVSEHSVVRLILSKDNIDVSSERLSGKYAEKINWDEEIKEEFSPITVYVDAMMMNFVSTRSLEFYLIKGTERNGKCIPRLLFVTDQSTHLMTTFDNE